MLEVDYNFYIGEYLGTVIQFEAWPALSRDAAAWLDAVTFGRANNNLQSEHLKACKMAVCAAAEVFAHERDGRNLTGETVGKWSRTYAADTRSMGRKLKDAADIWLSNTGLLYRGVTT